MARKPNDIMSLVLSIPRGDKPKIQGENLSVLGVNQMLPASEFEGRAPRMDFQYWPQSVKSSIAARKSTQTKETTAPFAGSEPRKISMTLLLDSTFSPLDRLEYYDSIRSKTISTEVAYFLIGTGFSSGPGEAEAALRKAAFSPAVDSLSLWSSDSRFVLSGPRGYRHLIKDRREFFSYGGDTKGSIENIVVASLRFLTAAISRMVIGWSHPVLEFDELSSFPSFFLVWTRSDTTLVHVEKFEAAISAFDETGLPLTALVKLDLVEAEKSQVVVADWLSRGGDTYYDAFIQKRDGSGSTQYKPREQGNG